MSALEERFAAVRERIASACRRVGRDPAGVQLVAVSKKHPIEAIRSLYAAGQRDFGENYVQELVQKADALRDLADLRMRAIGHVQRNKVKELVRVHATLDTLDSERLAEELAQRARAAGVTVEVLLQVNIGDEPQKAGVAVAELAPLVAAVRALPELSLRGLLAIPPATDDAEQSRPYFRRLRELAQAHELPELSMGMSDDFEIAIEEGATLVRLGTVIFGPRAQRSLG